VADVPSGPSLDSPPPPPHYASCDIEKEIKVTREELQFTNITGRVQAHEITDLMRKYGTTAEILSKKNIH
jgi:hypothetical protein